MITERLDRLLKQFVDNGVPGCGLAVCHKGRVVYTGYHGLASIEDSIEIDESTIYQIASCTKLVTAVAAMKLYEEGYFLLNDPLEYYLPCFKDMHYQYLDSSCEIIERPVTRPIILKDLLMMTSGIPYPGRGSLTADDYNQKIGPLDKLTHLNLQELAQKISEIPLEFDPGTRWRYGFSYDVMSAVVEVITGRRFSEYLKEAVFGPIGMSHTTFSCANRMRQNLANTYEIVNEKPANVTPEPHITETNDGRLEMGGGGLLSTLGDLAKFAGMLGSGGIWEGRRVLSRNTVDLMRRNHLRGQSLQDFQAMVKNAYPWYAGYGWGLAGRTMVDCQEAGSNGSPGEFGWCGAYGPYVLADPEKELGIAYTQQMSPVIGSMQDYCQPRIRNVVYALLDDLN